MWLPERTCPVLDLDELQSLKGVKPKDPRVSEVPVSVPDDALPTAPPAPDPFGTRGAEAGPPAASMEGIEEIPIRAQEPAAAWRRLVAMFIDGCMLIALQFVIVFAGVILFRLLSQVTVFFVLLGPVLLVTIMECSQLQATPGKWLMSLRVVSERGRPLAFYNGLVRNICKFYLFPLLNAVPLLFTKEGLSLYDYGADSRVVRRERK